MARRWRSTPSCSTPTAAIASPSSLRGPRDDPDGLGRRAAQVLRDQGAEPLLARVR